MRMYDCINIHTIVYYSMYIYILCFNCVSDLSVNACNPCNYCVSRCSHCICRNYSEKVNLRNSCTRYTMSGSAYNRKGLYTIALSPFSSVKKSVFQTSLVSKNRFFKLRCIKNDPLLRMGVRMTESNGSGVFLWCLYPTSFRERD